MSGNAGNWLEPTLRFLRWNALIVVVCILPAVPIVLAWVLSKFYGESLPRSYEQELGRKHARRWEYARLRRYGCHSKRQHRHHRRHHQLEA